MITKLQVQYINEHGEIMIVKKCDKDKFWFYHTDCNNDFELIDNLKDLNYGYAVVSIPDKREDGVFKYILDETERIILKNFLNNNK